MSARISATRNKWYSGTSADHRRRSKANTQAVTERQQTETLRRELKTARDGLAAIDDKVQQAERRKAKLNSEIELLAERDEEVSRDRARAHTVLY